MNIKLIYLSRNKNNNIELLVNDYEKKINHFVKFSSFCLKNKSQSNEKSQIIKSESDLILKNINEEDTVVLLDEKGKEYSSFELANLISTNMMDRTKNLTFLIGGAYGFSKELKEIFNLKISLIVTPELTKRGKPYPDPIFYAANLLSQKLDETLFIGDMISDMNSAKNAGCYFLFYTLGYEKEKNINYGGSITSLDQIKEFIVYL